MGWKDAEKVLGKEIQNLRKTITYDYSSGKKAVETDSSFRKHFLSQIRSLKQTVSDIKELAYKDEDASLEELKSLSDKIDLILSLLNNSYGNLEKIDKSADSVVRCDIDCLSHIANLKKEAEDLHRKLLSGSGPDKQKLHYLLFAADLLKKRLAERENLLKNSL